MFNAPDLLYFAGSVPLPDSEDVFRALSSEVGQFLRRMPDGETGERTLWIKFQQRMLLEHPQSNRHNTAAASVRQADGTVHRHIQLVRLRPSANVNSVEFDTGYDRAAVASYQTYRSLRQAGIISSEIRLQVALLIANGHRPHVA